MTKHLHLVPVELGPWNPTNGHDFLCKCRPCRLWWNEPLGMFIYQLWWEDRRKEPSDAKADRPV